MLQDLNGVINQQSGIPTRSNTNLPVGLQKQTRGLKFWIKVEEELYDASSKNKGTDQLCSYCTADLRLCFRIYADCWFYVQLCLNPGVTGNNQLLFSYRVCTNFQQTHTRYAAIKITPVFKKMLLKTKETAFQFEQHHEKTGFLPMQKQRCRSAVQ